MFLKIYQILVSDIGLIDLRNSDQFIKKHLKGSCSIPWERLPSSMHELPANHRPVAIMGSENQINDAAKFLTSKGYQLINQFEISEEIWSSAIEFNLLEEGCHSTQLWQANPLLIEAIDEIEKRINGREVLDLACGAGRDSVYLAKRGWNVTAIDYKQDALDRALHLADVNAVSIQTQRIDMESDTNPFADDIALTADLVMVMRYLHRPLFSAIDRLVKPGGAIFYSTFMVGSEQFGSPKNPAYLLKPGELAEIFSHYNILIDEQRKLADHRPIAYFLAQKPL